MKTTKMKSLLMSVLAFGFFASCSSKMHKYSSYSADRFLDDTSPAIQDTRLKKSRQQSGPQQRIVIHDATLRMVVKKPDTTNVKLSAIAEKYEGYVQTLGNTKSIIRVKSASLQNAVSDISALGQLKRKTVSGDDVTDQYTDYQIRLENAHNARKRYLELLAKAENVEAALKVEKELERLNGEIDVMEGRLKRLTHLSEYSTITVYLEEKVKPGILGYIGLGVYHAVKWLIVRN